MGFSFSGGSFPVSAMEFKGVWDANANSPSLVDGTGNQGDTYRVNVAGTQNLGSGAQTFVVGDLIIYDAVNIWRLAHAGADAAVVQDAINNGITALAPSQNAVFDALALKEDASSVAADARAAISAPVYTRYVDGLYAGGSSDGSMSRPFVTIQAALDTFPEPTTAAESKKRYVVWVHPGAYNEDIVIPAGLHCSILTDGFVSIGEGDLQNHASTTNRSITIEVNNANYFAGTTGGRPQIVIGSINGRMMGTTHPAYSTGFHIREVKFSQLGTPTANTIELTMVGCKIGSPGVVSTGTQNTNMSFYNCFCSGPITTTGSGLIYEMQNTEVDGLVTTNKINRTWMCSLDGGVTVASADSGTQAPSGFFQTIIGGTFTGPASSYRVDLSTKALSSPTLAGGATEVLLDAAAKLDLSNLASVAINTHLLPGTTNAVDLGSTAKVIRRLVTYGITDNLGTEVATFSGSSRLFYDVLGVNAIDFNTRKMYNAAGTQVCVWSAGSPVFNLDIVMDNQKGIYFQEAVANGSSSVAIIAPASLASSYTITLPVDDGAADDSMVSDGSGVLSFAARAKTDLSNIASTAIPVDLILNVAGKSIQIKEGSNAKMGQATLASGTVTVSTTAALTNSRIFLTRASKGSSTAIGGLEITSISNATNFVITALKPADATTETGDLSVINWLIVDPS